MMPAHLENNPKKANGQGNPQLPSRTVAGKTREWFGRLLEIVPVKKNAPAEQKPTMLRMDTEQLDAVIRAIKRWDGRAKEMHVEWWVRNLENIDAGDALEIIRELCSNRGALKTALPNPSNFLEKVARIVSKKEGKCNWDMLRYAVNVFEKKPVSMEEVFRRYGHIAQLPPPTFSYEAYLKENLRNTHKARARNLARKTLWRITIPLAIVSTLAGKPIIDALITARENAVWNPSDQKTELVHRPGLVPEITYVYVPPRLVAHKRMVKKESRAMYEKREKIMATTQSERDEYNSLLKSYAAEQLKENLSLTELQRYKLERLAESGNPAYLSGNLPIPSSKRLMQIMNNLNPKSELLNAAERKRQELFADEKKDGLNLVYGTLWAALSGLFTVVAYLLSSYGLRRLADRSIRKNNQKA